MRGAGAFRYAHKKKSSRFIGCRMKIRNNFPIPAAGVVCLLLILGHCCLLSDAFAQAYSGECGSCVDRKQKLCGEECELVPPEKSLHCQQTCLEHYCDHRCAPDAPELKAYLRENCDDCLEQQFKVCESHCTVGTPRRKASCQLFCSRQRCAGSCPSKPSPSGEDKDSKSQ